MKRWWLVIVLFIIIVLGVLALVIIPGPKTAKAPTNPLADVIVVTSPLPNATIESTTVTITGKARGSWYFEASFPIVLKDANSATLAQTHGQAQDDWMTADFVPFTATLTFPQQPAGSHGTVVLKNDNPSGDPAKQLELDIPVVF